VRGGGDDFFEVAEKLVCVVGGEEEFGVWGKRKKGKRERRKTISFSPVQARVVKARYEREERWRGVGGGKIMFDVPSNSGIESTNRTAQKPTGAILVTNILATRSAAFLFSPPWYASKKSRYIGRKLSRLARIGNVGLPAVQRWWEKTEESVVVARGETEVEWYSGPGMKWGESGEKREGGMVLTWVMNSVGPGRRERERRGKDVWRVRWCIRAHRREREEEEGGR
jgi:hypothetical protein